MTLTEQIYAQAVLLTQDAESENLPMLEILCRSAEVSLKQNLRDGITPEDCKADFVAAASLYALAALSEMDELAQLSEIQVKDLTMRRGSTNTAACCLRFQAERMIQPYLKERFQFMGV